MIQIHPAVLTIIAGALLAVIGFLTAMFINRVLETQKNLASSIEKLNLSLTGLNSTINAMKDMNEMFQDSCRERHARIDKELLSIKEKVE